MTKAKIKTITALACIFGCVLSGETHAEIGAWVESKEFAQLNVACVRTYICSTGQDIMYDASKKLVVSSPKLVSGICSVADGAIDSCNVCLTNPPSEACEWHLEEK